jgi:hypothetical protein
MRPLLLALAFLAVATSANAQSNGCAAGPTASPEIAGNYVDNFDGLQAVSDHFWYSGGLVFETCSVDNPGHRLIAHNNSANSFNPGKFSRFEWTKSDNRLWYCQSVFDAATEQAAASAPPADPAHPATGGCGTFAWSTLIHILP